MQIVNSKLREYFTAYFERLCHDSENLTGINIKF